MAFNAGNAFITISPDMSKFTKEIKAKFADQGEQAAKSFGTSFKSALGTLDAKVKADADTTAAKAKLDALSKDRSVKVKAKVSIDKSALKSLALPALAVGGSAALGPTALAGAAVLTGIGVAAGSAVGGLAAFAAVAKGPVTAALKANQDAAKGDLTALQALSPAGRQLATELGGLTTAWAALEKAETPAISSALSPWVSAATSGMRLLSPVVEDVAGALQLLGMQADAAIKSPFWDKFASTFGAVAQVSLTGFGDALGHVADGFAHLFVDFAPDLAQLPGLVDNWAKSFDNWAKSYNASGLESFVSKTFSPENRALLKTDLQNLATALGNVGKALGNLSPSAFSGLSNVLAVLAKLSPGQIEAIAALYAVSKTVGGVGNLASLLGGASLAGGKSGKSGGKGGLLGLLGLGAGSLGTGLVVGNVAGGIANAAHPASASQAQTFQDAAGPLNLAFGGSQNAASLLGPVVNLGAPRQPPKAAPGQGSEPMPGTPAFKAYQDKILGAQASPVDRVWSTSYEDFQRDFAGPMTAWFTNSLPNFFVNAIPQNVWSPAYEGFQRDVAGPMTAWFTQSLPNFFTSGIPGAWSWAYTGFENNVGSPVAAWFTNSLPNFFTSGVPGAWSWAYTGFENNVGSPVAAWFTQSVPHFFTSSVPAAWSWAYTGFENNVGSPVAAWFSQSVPHFFTSSVPAAWSWAWTGFMSNVGTPVANWFSQSVPHFFTSTVPSAWGWAWSEFGTHIGTPVANWFSQSVPHFFTSSVPNAFSWAWSEFNSNVISPISNWFSSTLPGLVSQGQSLLGKVGGLLGFASGTKSAPPGWAWVGEHGPELMHFAGGEQVLNHTASLAKARSMSALGSLNVPTLSAPVRLPGVSSPGRGAGAIPLVISAAGNDPLLQAVVGALQGHVIGATGGDVQAALGHGPVRLP